MKGGIALNSLAQVVFGEIQVSVRAETSIFF